MRLLAAVLTALSALGCADLEPVSDEPDGGAGTGGASDGGAEGSPPPDGGLCWTDQKWCGVCVDLADPSHGCDSTGCDPCPTPHATAKCEAGKCAVKACDAGWADCNQSATDGCEVDTASDHSHCGKCGGACAASEVCLAGACASNCGSLQNCAGSCVNAATNSQHCGACNHACAGSQTCQAGKCVCPAGLTSCAGACIDTKVSKQHCGGCNKPCTDPANGLAACQAGQCALACLAGFSLCGGQCVVTATHVSHCGGCNKACGLGEACQDGACVATFSASAGFSSVQGKNGWSYLSSDGAAMSYVLAQNYWQGAETYVIVTAGGGHPGVNLDAVRRWTAPKSGSVKITGKAFDTHAGCGADGVNVSIRKGATVLWQATIAKDDATGQSYDLTAAVSAGEKIDFVLNKGAEDACDSSHFDPTIVLTYKP